MASRHRTRDRATGDGDITTAPRPSARPRRRYDQCTAASFPRATEGQRAVPAAPNTPRAVRHRQRRPFPRTVRGRRRRGRGARGAADALGAAAPVDREGGAGAGGADQRPRRAFAQQADVPAARQESALPGVGCRVRRVVASRGQKGSPHLRRDGPAAGGLRRAVGRGRGRG